MADNQRVATIRSPGGRTATVRVPADATEEQINEKINMVKQQLLAAEEVDAFVSQKVDQTPTGFDPTPLMPQKFAPSVTAEEISNFPPIRQAAASESGTDVTTGLSADIRAKAGLMNFNPVTRALVIDELVRGQFAAGEIPETLPVVKGNQYTEGLEYLRKTEDGKYKYTLVDPVGFEGGDLAEFAGEVPGLIPEVIGAIGGAVAGQATMIPGAQWLGGTLGAGAGAYMSLDVRTAVAKMLGIPDELLDGAVTSDARLREASLSVAGDLTTAITMGTGKMLANFFKRPLKAEDIPKLEEAILKNLEILREAERVGGKAISPRIGTLTQDPNMAVQEARLRKKARGDDAVDMSVNDIEVNRAAGDALHELSKQVTRTPPDSMRSVSEVTEDVVRGVRSDLSAAQQAKDLAEGRIAGAQSGLADTPNPDLFIRTRDDAYESAEAARKAATDAWDGWRNFIGFKQGQGSDLIIQASGGSSPIKKYLLGLEEESSAALLKSTEQSQLKFVRDAGLPEEGATEGLAAEFLDPRQLHFALSDLKRRLRHIDRGVDIDGFKREDVSGLIGAIEETINTAPMIRRSTNKAATEDELSTARGLFSAANDTTRAMHSLYDGANMRELLATRYRVRDGQGVVELDTPAGLIEKDMFKPHDARFLSDALDGVNNNPEVIAGLAQQLERKFNKAVFNEAGEFQPGKFNEFMEQHRDHMKIVMPNADIDNLRSIQDMHRAVVRATKDYETLRGQVEASYGRKLAEGGTDPINIANDMLNTLPLANVRNLMTKLDSMSPQLATEVRDHVAAQVKRDLSVKGGMLNGPSTRNLLETRSGELTAVHGAQYVKDLKALSEWQDLLDTSNTMMRTATDEIQGPNIRAMRLFWGPLSRPQRFISAANRYARATQANVAKELMADPTSLRRFVKTATGADEAAFWLMAGDVGITPFLAAEQQERSDAILKDYARRNEPRGNAPMTRQDQAKQGATFDMPHTVEQLKRHEGLRLTTYKDSVREKTTIGYGRNLTDKPLRPYEIEKLGRDLKEGDSITKEEAQYLFENDVADSVSLLRKHVPVFDKLGPVRQQVLLNMTFNLGMGVKGGEGGLLGFSKTLKHIEDGNYNEAANEMLRSNWARQVGSRSGELSKMMRTGEYK